MRQRRATKSEGRVTIGDLARAYDESKAGRPIRLGNRRLAANAVSRTSRTLNGDQSDHRLARLKARADGIRFALQYENQGAAQAKVLQQILQNLELAIRGMEMTARES
ncbi:hypothetical protein [Thalassobaculum sp.]|uniref:hypothetical protein n=1 Tax=Thalassobaculum sp. TaxID=2022740 RepID=UPI0032ED7F2B